VADTNNQHVEKFNSSGTYVSQFGSSGSGNGQFSGPNTIAFDGSGNLWVVDSGNNRVQEFNSSGTYLSQIGCASGVCASGSGNGQFNNPDGIAIGSR
jgi:DNA-binding beta-propeller fold protein YncE